MGEIRFVGTDETRGYPYLVCKKRTSQVRLDQTMKYYKKNMHSVISNVRFYHNAEQIVQVSPRTSKLNLAWT